MISNLFQVFHVLQFIYQIYYNKTKLSLYLNKEIIYFIVYFVLWREIIQAVYIVQYERFRLPNLPENPIFMTVSELFLS